ncbi:hypothetical protein OUZ56_020684 [Daphnia magna]|uniref:Uncharacterized protein n=1 Tax=Daphnia magna TaxID=35525 RepID=A0ABQ9ZF54_9CRUS|nr:hypothetical protein OUZ56_020684 [Daphnia magna]
MFHLISHTERVMSFINTSCVATDNAHAITEICGLDKNSERQENCICHLPIRLFNKLQLRLNSGQKFPRQ